MTTPITFTLYLADGVTRNPTATPTFSGGKYVTRSNVARTPPTIANHGLGKYSIEGTADDEAMGCAFLIATGATPDYVFGSITTADKPFAVVAFFNNDGTLISSGTPTIPAGAYQDMSGTALTPQAVNGMGPALFSLTPLDTELAAGGVNWIISAPAGALPSSYDGDLIAGSLYLVGTAPILIPATFGSVDPRGIKDARDLAYDHQTGKFKRSTSGGRYYTSGLDGVRQAINIKLMTFLGECFLDTTRGVPHFEMILVKAPNFAAIQAELTQQILAVAGVLSVTSVVLNFNKATRSLLSTWTVNTIYGATSGTT